MQYTYGIKGIHCAACLDKIKAALLPISKTIELSLNPPMVKLETKEPLSIAELNQRIALAGDYQLLPLENPIMETNSELEPSKGWLATYYPLILIVAYITAVSLISSLSAIGINWHNWMLNFMAGFFLVFSAFKFLNLPGFAEAYATYDLLARRSLTYAFIYPFLELILGIAYLAQIVLVPTYLFTIILMGFSSIGVIKALMDKWKIQCACLGTFLQVPMSIITLVEDLAMVLMAVIMLVATM